MESRRKRGKKAGLLDEGGEIPDHLGHVWQAFAVLSAGRTSNGYGPNPIPVSEILQTAAFFHIDPDDALFLIQGLDKVYLEVSAEKAAQARARAKS